MQYKNIICKYCGNHAVVSTLRKMDYCNNKECQMKAHAEVSRNNYSRKTETNNVARTVSTQALDSMDCSDLRELTNIFGDLRYRLIKLKEKVDNEEQNYTKRDDIILHKIEFGNLTRDEKLEIIDKIEADRLKRREAKIKKEIVVSLLDSIKIKNPNKFLTEVLKEARNTRDLKGCIENLKSDNTLFVAQK